MPEKTTREILTSLLNSQITGVLATEKKHQPYANLIAFSFSDDYKKIIFATPTNTTKYQNLIENPQVSILIDSRKNDPNNFSGSTAITVLGLSRELTGDLKTRMMMNHAARLPGLVDFLKTELITIFEIEVSKYIITNGLNSTSVYEP
jgi:heme iron utilization protein